MYHYTYIIKDKHSNKKYIGVRSCKCKPCNDDYWGSSKYIPKDVKTTHNKRILQKFNTRKEAVEHEIYLHNKYNVAVNPCFYNKAKQTSYKFDTAGTTFNLSEEAKQKISLANSGKKRTPEQIEQMRVRMLGSKQSAQTCKKRGDSIKKNQSNKGIKNSQFKPWYIMTDTFTYLFYDTSKNEQSIIDGHYKKYYADLQKKINRKGFAMTKQYGRITMGNIPT